ncbi:MFS transporter [Spirillospora sp. NPDC052242]
MSTSSISPPRAGGGKAPALGHHPGLALLIVSTAQLMVVLDGTIVAVALPSIQSDLGFTPSGASWVFNAYLLAFGGLLMLGGRSGDVFGHRRAFMTGVALFALASLLGGFSTEAWHLLLARVGQGVAAALAAPAALALVNTSFTDTEARNRALGVFAGVAGSGMAIGLILGGLLTDGLSWHWVLWVNVPIAAVLLVLSPLYLSGAPGVPSRFDVLGSLTSIAGMVALVYGFVHAGEKGWGEAASIGALAAGVLLLALFVFIETRTAQPILSLRLLADRDRAAGFLSMMLLPATLFAMFVYLVSFLQNVLGFSAIRTGLAFLALAAVMMVAASVAAPLMARFGPKKAIVAASVVTVAGMVWLARLSVGSGYFQDIFGPMVLFGAGAGIAFACLNVVVMSTVQGAEAGAASGLLNTVQQVGAALGLAVLTTVYTGALRDGAESPPAGVAPAEAQTHILTDATSSVFTAAIAFPACLLVAALLLRRPSAASPAPAEKAPAL